MNDRLRMHAQLAAWQAMRTTMPPAHWSVTACDAITDAVLNAVRRQEGTDIPPDVTRDEIPG